MTLRNFLDLFDDWNARPVVINGDDLENPLYIFMSIQRLMDHKANDPIMEKPVLAFGFYDGELCVRVRRTI